MNDVGLQAEWQVMTRRQRVLQRHEELPQRPAGGAGRAHRRGPRALRGGQPPQRRRSSRATTTSSSIHDPAAVRPAVLGAPTATGHDALDLALPHRHLDARPGALRLPAAVHPPLRPGDLHHGRLRARGARRAARGGAAGDRPAGPQEHDAGARRRPLHRAPVRHRRRPPAAAAGLALRSLEGPARRGRRLPRRSRRAGPTCSSP